MKNLKKLFAALFSLTAVFLFFACSNDDTEEDENLEVTISASGSESDSSRTITMSAPASYSGTTVYIVYTIDGSEPSVTYNSTAYSSTAELTQYIDYGTANLYRGGVSFAESVVVNAKAFYIKDSRAYVGPLATATVNVKSSVETPTTTDTGTVAGNFTFRLATSGNSNITHYFDTSSTNVFTWGEVQHCYYQIQFSYKGKGKGNWYLYVREIGNATPIKDSTNSTNFVAQGTYEGDCFNSSDGSVSAGKLTLSSSGGTNGYAGTYSVSKLDGDTFSLSMKVNGDASSGVSVGDAK